MSAEGRAKLWNREKTQNNLARANASTERKPFHGVMAARRALCMPEPDRVVDEKPDLPSAAERGLFFDKGAELDYLAALKDRDS